MGKQLKIRIYPDGRIESETVGIKGKNCLSYIKDVENLTGAKTVHSSFTQEYNETEIEQNSYVEEQQYNGY